MIQDHNRNTKASFEMGINEFADMTEEEIKKMLGKKIDEVEPLEDHLETS